ncbi:MAG: DUF2934 domain-containing protein [Bauldia sp.]
MSTENTEMMIRTRAYAIWEAAGRPDGQAEEHWLQALREAGAAPAMTTPEAAAPKKTRAKKVVESASIAPEDLPKAPAKKKAPAKTKVKA